MIEKMMIIVLIILSTRSFLSAYTITHEPLHAAWWHFPWTRILTTARTLLILKIIGQRSRSQDRIFEFFTIAKKLMDTITREPLHSAWWNFAWALYCDNHTNSISFHQSHIGQRSRSFFRKWTKVYQIVSEREKNRRLVHNAVIHLSIAWSVPEISRSKSRVVQNLGHCG